MVLKVKFSAQTRLTKCACACVCVWNEQQSERKSRAARPFFSLFTKAIIIIFGAVPCIRSERVIVWLFLLQCTYNKCMHVDFECQCDGLENGIRRTSGGIRSPNGCIIFVVYQQIGCRTFPNVTVAIEWFLMHQHELILSLSLCQRHRPSQHKILLLDAQCALVSVVLSCVFSS